MPGTADTHTSLVPYAWHCKYKRFLGPYAWHYKYQRFLGPLCQALQIPTFPWTPMPGTVQIPTFPWTPTPGIANTIVYLNPYAWHYKCQRFLGPLCLALQKRTFPLVAMPGSINTGVSLGPYAWHYKCQRFLGPLCLALQIPAFPWTPMPGTANTAASLSRYAWHCKYRHFLGPLCLALAVPKQCFPLSLKQTCADIRAGDRTMLRMPSHRSNNNNNNNKHKLKRPLCSSMPFRCVGRPGDRACPQDGLALQTHNKTNGFLGPISQTCVSVRASDRTFL